MLSEFEDLFDFLKLNLSKKNFNQVNSLRKTQNVIDTQEQVK